MLSHQCRWFCVSEEWLIDNSEVTSAVVSAAVYKALHSCLVFSAKLRQTSGICCVAVPTATYNTVQSNKVKQVTYNTVQSNKA